MLCSKQKSQRKGRRNCQQGKTPAVIRKGVAAALEIHHDKKHYGTGECAKLIQEFLQCEAAPHAVLCSGKRQKSVLGRFLDCFSGALGHDERGSPHPSVFRDQCQRRHCEKVNGISCNCQCPVLPCTVGQTACGIPQRVSDQLPQSGNKADCGSRRPGKAQIGAENTFSSLVSHVGKQAHNPHQQNKRQRGTAQRPGCFFRFNHLYSASRLNMNF